MGSDHESGDLPPHDGWPEGVYTAVNMLSRIHGYWVNSTDKLFYKGSQDELQSMTRQLTNAEGTRTELILHIGAGIAKSPWSKMPVGTADWSVTIAGPDAISKTQGMITIDVWIGGNISLDELDLPPSVRIKSGGEIDAFIKRHDDSRDAQAGG
ncbi:hypothetical protein [Crateriforma spongiae]|uniref:hypothetical protein n=1 Tax=Crateriforma spongiae TaxID=2724528 RepID=UPI0014469E66|nr:hypothetical protein [Crateriforma spongiae]